MRIAPAEVLWTPPTDADGFLPEGPRWLRVADRPTLAWVNIQTATDATTGTIHLLDWATREHRALPQAGRPGFLLPTTRPNIVLVGRDKELGWVDLHTNAWTPIVRIPNESPRTIINDAEIVPGGHAVVFGTKDVQFADPLGHLYLFTPADGQVTVLADQQTCSNGKVFVGATTLYDIDTPTKCVRRYQLNVAQRTLTASGVAVDLRAEEAFPDGMVAADADHLLIAFYQPHRGGDGQVSQYRLAIGGILGPIVTLAVPGSPRVTCPLLAATPDGTRLILTTATEGMPAEQRATAPNAGCLFVAPWSGLIPPAESVQWPS